MTMERACESGHHERDQQACESDYPGCADSGSDTRSDRYEKHRADQIDIDPQMAGVDLSQAEYVEHTG